MVKLLVGDPLTPVAKFGSLADARAFVEQRAATLQLKCVERDCGNGRVQFVVKSHETKGVPGFVALCQATVYEVTPCA
jgi:acylphosphatase